MVHLRIEFLITLNWCAAAIPLYCSRRMLQDIYNKSSASRSIKKIQTGQFLEGVRNVDLPLARIAEGRSSLLNQAGYSPVRYVLNVCSADSVDRLVCLHIG